MQTTDFLADAANHCHRQLMAKRATSPLEAGGSVCVRREEGERYYRALYRVTRFNLLVGGTLVIIAIAFGLIAAFMAGTILPVPPISLYVVAGALLAAAILLLSRIAMFDRWIKRRAPETWDDALAVSESPVLRVSIEDPETFNQFKLLSDDCGFIALLPSARMVVIEGLRYRQFIRAEDLIDTYDQEAASVKSIGLEYLAGSPEQNRIEARITLSCSSQHGELQIGLAECFAPLEDETHERALTDSEDFA